ncbi:MAG: methyltransferase domain-containing protein, partial [Bacteroidetes bacterium]|nr:methyltransferase domain-containing protein [Bacteroidota bacterium]
MTNHFDQVAHDWDKNQMHIQRTNAIAKELLKITKNKNITKALEFGAGTGLLSFALKDFIHEITLMDSSSEMISIARNKVNDAGLTNIN